MELSRSETVAEAVDADIDRSLVPRSDLAVPQLRVLAVVGAGGAVGASVRYAISLALPAAPAGFPLSTLLINMLGCALIGVFMVLVAETWAPHPLLRPFVATGVLGGFTTFSTYAVDIERLIAAGQVVIGFAYLVSTLLGALASVWVATSVARWAIRRRR